MKPNMIEGNGQFLGRVMIIQPHTIDRSLTFSLAITYEVLVKSKIIFGSFCDVSASLPQSIVCIWQSMIYVGQVIKFCESTSF